MGSGAGADKRGRYEEKGGGQYVNSLFAESTENEKIKSVYGNYNLWSWLRYWYLDTENYITWMLMDKGCHDYDYHEPKPKPRPLTEEEKKLWSKDKLARLFKKKTQPEVGPLEEELQKQIREDKNLK